MAEPTSWGADVRVSMPAPLEGDNQGLIPMGGFCFTAAGLFHDLSEADWAKMSIPTFAPHRPQAEAVRYDAGLDGQR